MVRLIVLTLVGFAFFFGAVKFGYTYLMAGDAGYSYATLYIIPTLICLTLSAISLLFAGRSKHVYPTDEAQQANAKNDPSITGIGIESSLEKQNFIIAQWRKTNNLRDKMKMMKITAAAQQKPKF